MSRFFLVFPLILAGTGTITATANARALTATPDAIRQMFIKADTNHDGVLTLDEWKATGRRERGFNMIDTNHDGQVTPEELKAAAAKFGR